MYASLKLGQIKTNAEITFITFHQKPKILNYKITLIFSMYLISWESNMLIKLTKLSISNSITLNITSVPSSNSKLELCLPFISRSNRYTAPLKIILLKIWDYNFHKLVLIVCYPLQNIIVDAPWIRYFARITNQEICLQQSE